MPDNFSIMIVDQYQDHADGVAEALEQYSDDISVIYDAKQALDCLDNHFYNMVITGLKFAEAVRGLDILKKAKSVNSDCEVILITAYSSVETCKQALKQGAYDYLKKPVDINQLKKLTERIRDKYLRKQEFRKTNVISQDGFVFDGVIGSSRKMRKLFDVLKRVAPTNLPVLVEGASGTGKELIANAIHRNSNRSGEPFMPVNCAGFTESLLESELFGHSKGAFTGAAADRKGLFEAADKGTLFLDEIGDMPMNMQAKLLRVLEDGTVTPVGSNKTVVVDVRVISATNHDLAKLVKESKFRQDLYFRIKGVSLTVPSLAERREDISELIRYFLHEAAQQTGSEVADITEEAENVLINYNWPGNIRQLRNCIQIMVVMSDNNTLDVKDIPPEIHQIRRLGPGRKTSENLAGVSLDDLEKQAILDTLSKTGNNRAETAKILGIGERTLYRKIKEYGL
jgi:two-component system response regulator HydG